MNQSSWKQTRELFHRAMALPPGERTAFLNEACAGDTELLAGVERLWGFHDSDFLEESALSAASGLLADPNFQPGQIIGRYKLQELIGTGGMGEVFLADDTELNRPVAFKFLHRDVAEDPERVRRFIQEARAASALNHPNILTIHEIGTFAGANYIVSEFINGETLRERMHHGLTVTESLDIAAQVAAALQAAHEAGIVHRDIKPENIMLRRDGLVKVLDFGLAKLLEVRSEECEMRNKEAETPVPSSSDTPHSALRTPPSAFNQPRPYHGYGRLHVARTGKGPGCRCKNRSLESWGRAP